jgi:hypothetical protein
MKSFKIKVLATSSYALQEVSGLCPTLTLRVGSGQRDRVVGSRPTRSRVGLQALNPGEGVKEDFVYLF